MEVAGHVCCVWYLWSPLRVTWILVYHRGSFGSHPRSVSNPWSDPVAGFCLRRGCRRAACMRGLKRGPQTGKTKNTVGIQQ